MSYYSDLNSHIRDKVKVVLDLPNYATKKLATDIDTSGLAPKKILLLRKLELTN